MKILHTADWHVGSGRRFLKHLTDHLEREKQVVGEILALIKREQPDVVIIAGDLFDNGNPTHDERLIVANFFRDVSVPVVAISGNHDTPGRVGTTETNINWLVALSDKLGHVVKDSPTAVLAYGAWWLCLPYGGWNQADLNLLVAWLLSKIPASNTKPVVALAHEFFCGATTETGFVGKGKKHPKVPEDPAITYWALGDIHNQQNLGPTIWYCGTPYQKDFGESLPKGVLMVKPGKKPVPIQLRKTTPLVTLTSVPDEWPNALIRLKVKASKIPPLLPKNVVEVSSPPMAGASAEMEEKIAQGSRYLLDGLDGFLKRRGLSPKMVKRGVAYAKQLLKETTDV